MTFSCFLWRSIYPIINTDATNSRHARADKASGPDNPWPLSCVIAVGCALHAGLVFQEASVRKLALALLIISGGAISLGCRDNSPEVQRVPTPAPGHDSARPEYDHPKPLP